MTNGVVQGSEVIRAEKYGSDRTDTDAYHHHNYAGQPRLSKENLTHATFREVIPLTSSKKNCCLYTEPLLFMLRPTLLATE